MLIVGVEISGQARNDGCVKVYKFVFFTLLSSTFPLIRGKRSELTMHKIVKIAVECWGLACRLSACSCFDVCFHRAIPCAIDFRLSACVRR